MLLEVSPHPLYLDSAHPTMSDQFIVLRLGLQETSTLGRYNHDQLTNSRGQDHRDLPTNISREQW